MATAPAAGYRPLTLAQAGALMTGVDESLRWRFLAEFLEEYSWEDAEVRHGLLSEEPETVGEQTWDVLLAALAEHLAARDGKAAPGWSQTRTLRRFWFPFNTPAARVDAVVTAPAAFRRRGVFLAAHELDVA
jgi:hypothetical protein